MTRYEWFDVVRGLSALAVCASHLRNAILVDFGQLANPTLCQKLFYSANALGHQSVLIFFVLSGFFVGGSVLKRAQSFDFRDYLCDRLSRLWTVLLPALVLTCGVDLVIENVAPDILEGARRGLMHSGPPADGSYSRGVVTFLGNVLFSQTIFVQTYGTLDPVWSLANEFWYYMMFPALACAVGILKPYSAIKKRIAGGFCLVLICVILPPKFYVGFAVWMVGVGVWWILDSNKKSFGRWSLIASIGLSASILYSLSSGWQEKMGFSADIAIGGTFGIFMVTVARNRVPKLVEPTFRFLSEMSFSLYLVHFPIVMLIVALYYKEGKVAPDVFGLLQFLGWMGGLCLISILFWFCFERQTGVLRDSFRTCFGRSAVRSA